MLNIVDFKGFNRLLTQYAIQKGTGGAFVVDDFAPPTPVETQAYVIPNLETDLVRQGIVDESVGPDGRLNERQPVAPDFSEGKCNRRGFKGYTQDEIKAQPHGELFGDEQSEIDSAVDDLRRNQEIRFKALLDAQKSVSGHHASPAVKWDAAGYTNVDTIRNIEVGLRAAELSSGKSVDSGNWKVLIPPLVADALRGYLRTKLLYTDGQFQLNGILPSRLANATVYVPGAMNNSSAAGQTASVARIWNTDDVYLVYVDPSFAKNRRTFTALAQMRWNALSPSYAARQWRCDDPTCLRTHVSTEIWDNLELLSADGIYVLDDVLT